MWDTILQINSVLLVLSGIYLIYSLGAAILTLSWKQFLFAILLFAFFGVVEIIIAAIIES